MTVFDAASQRQQLGKALQKLRKDADLTGPQLAERVGVAQSTVSRLENGRAFPPPDLLDRWAAATGATDVQRDHLDDLAETAAVEVVGWRRRPRRLDELQRDTADLEESSGLIRGYHPVLVNSLLQVPGYALAAYRARAQIEGQSDAEVTRAIRERMAKQALLSREGHRFEFVLTEVGLRWRFVPHQVLAAQLDRLAQVAQMPNILIGVIPAELEVAVFGWQGFAAFLNRTGAEDLVLVETLTRTLTVHGPDDVARYQDVFVRLLDVAATGDQALALLARVAADL